MPRKPGPRPARRPSLTTLRRRREETLTLAVRHHINGTPYGPGVVTVTGDLAEMLRMQERYARETEEAFHGKRATIITQGPTGAIRQTPVAYDTFDRPEALIGLGVRAF